MGVANEIEPRHMVAIQLKNFTPVGTAIKNDRKLKNGLLTAPVVNMWWAQTPIERPAIANAASTIPVYPKIGLRENTGMISLITPKYGRIITYTSGWPKNQNRCCQSTTFPPAAGSKA